MVCKICIKCYDNLPTITHMWQPLGKWTIWHFVKQEKYEHIISVRTRTFFLFKQKNYTPTYAYVFYTPTFLNNRMYTVCVYTKYDIRNMQHYTFSVLKLSSINLIITSVILHILCIKVAIYRRNN